MKKIAIALLLMVSTNVSADVMHYSLCSLIEGKSMADAQQWLDDWRTLVSKEHITYSVRLLLPHASPQGLGDFFIEGATPTLSTYAAAWDWWYSDEKAAASNAQLMSVATCTENSVYMTTD